MAASPAILISEFTLNPLKWVVKAVLLSQFFHLSFSFDTITPQHSIKDGDVVVSSGNKFALGFFSPGNTNYRYVGVWYQIPKKTVVWVANREDPVNDASGILSISSQGNLVLHQKSQTIPVWSTNASVSHSNDTVARLLDSGNLVLLQNGTPVWQSFDNPTNTLLPSMIIGLNLSTGLNRFLTPWKSPDDPGIGSYTYKIDPSGFPQLFFYKDSVKFWRGGSWTGRRWVGIPQMTRSHLLSYSFIYNNVEISFMFGLMNASIFSRTVANETGLMKKFIWNPEDQSWVEVWSAPKEECEYYGHCGPNSKCDQSQVIHRSECSCLPGFEPKSTVAGLLRDWSAGCARKPNASICQGGEGFVKVARVKLPDTATANADLSLGLKQCKDKCLRNCSCMAYATAFSELNGGTGCLTWYGDLVDVETYTDGGQDLYVRVDAVDLARYTKKGLFQKKGVLAILVVSSATVFLIVVALLYQSVIRQRRGKRRQNKNAFTTSTLLLEDSLGGNEIDESKRNGDLPFFDLSTIAAATNNFSSDNKLGQGGFGSVYKGVLFNGKDIAVKRLSKYSGQGVEEFKNEIMLIAKLQHRNLIRILGCCVEGEEKMLIYEYLPNKSLNSIIFDETKRSLLDWKKRFEIICGVARGILYLHQDSRFRIIHRDLKASNILLDASMIPKISDFGMARIFGGDQMEGNTNRIVGTYGYMSPEYAMDGQFSVKSDVYSFGVLLLEIITGRKNSGYYPDSPLSNLVGHVWDLWEDGKAMELVDSALGDSYPANEILKSIQIGLLCLEEQATDRPTMSSVVFMLNNETTLPSPKRPAFTVKKADKGDEVWSTEGLSSVNDVTISMLHAR